jgi:excisionase family DNA binding protein
MIYTTKEAADALNVSKPTLLRWIREGFVPDVTKDGRSWRRWTDEDLEKVRKFMQSYREASSDEDLIRNKYVRD